MKTLKNICYTELGHKNQVLDLYLPESDEFSVFVYFHGGGLEAGSKDTGEIMAEYLTERNIALVSADYRMYPEAAFPDFLRDAAAAVSWTFKNIGSYGKCDKIYVGGSSAGGYISLMLCFDKKYLAPFKIKPMDIAGFIHDAGQPTAHFNVLRERGIDSRRVIVDETAPLYFVGVDEEYPKMHVIVSDNDMQNRLEQTMLLESTMKHFGHEDKIKVSVMHGTHCHYEKAVDANGVSEFGKIVYNCISEMEA